MRTNSRKCGSLRSFYPSYKTVWRTCAIHGADPPSWQQGVTHGYVAGNAAQHRYHSVRKCDEDVPPHATSAGRCNDGRCERRPNSHGQREPPTCGWRRYNYCFSTERSIVQAIEGIHQGVQQDVDQWDAQAKRYLEMAWWTSLARSVRTVK